METARSRLDTAQAQLMIAEDQVSRTDLRVDAAGIVTAAPVEAGEVVQAGQMIIRIARQDGRDAVFDVPGQILRSAPSDPLITVTLTDDPAVKATGRVREVAPQADPVTRTFEVKVGLTDAPAAMRLGSTVAGRMQLDAAPTIELPASALTELDRRPAVWVVDPKDLTVSPRNVDVLRHDPATVAIASGLEPGEIVVTAGTQALHPGQKTRLLGSPH
jgi:RND family efflux transporter MFP subunit